jgi:hypothetical protein
MIRTLTRVLTAFVLALAVAACSSDGSGDGSSSSPTGGSSPPTTYSISGTVSGGVQGGVTIGLTPGGASVVTGTDGTFSLSGLATGNYTVTPSLTGYSFTPASTAVTISSANVTGVNLTAAANPVVPPATYSISGTVSGGAQAGVTISVSPGGASVVTDASGNFVLSGLTNGGYTVTPSSARVTFTPSSIPVTVNGADVTGVNFTTPFPALAAGKELYPCYGAICSNDLSTGTISVLSSQSTNLIVPARVGGQIAFQTGSCLMSMSLTTLSPFCAIPSWTGGVAQGSFDITQDAGVTGVVAMSQIFTTPGYPDQRNIILYMMDGSGFQFRVTNGADVDTSPVIASTGNANSTLTLLWVRNGTEILEQDVDPSNNGLIGVATVFASDVKDGVRAMSVNVDYTRVAFMKNVDGVPHISVKPLAGGAEVDLGVGANPYWTLDGSDRIMFTGVNNEALWAISPDGTGKVQVPVPSNFKVGPVGGFFGLGGLTLSSIVFGPAGF